jgi:tRNA(Ile)-lysidine synthase
LVSSKKTVVGTNTAAVTNAVHAEWARLSQTQAIQRVGVALSGGRDSMVLLHALHQLLRPLAEVKLIALSVDHQLQASSGSWVSFCQAKCQEWQIEFCFETVEVARNRQSGLEGAARQARYAALAGMASRFNLNVIALGHHLNDQAETLLLQLDRGTGLTGLAGMPVLLLRNGQHWWRPMIRAVSRAQIDQYVEHHKIEFAEDPTNAQTHLKRNAIRHEVLPALVQQFPAIVANLGALSVQASQLWQQQQAHAKQLWLQVHLPDAPISVISRPAMNALSRADQDLLLRYWIGLLGLRMPTQARLHQLREQLLHASANALPKVLHEGWVFGRSANNLVAVERAVVSSDRAEEPHLLWRIAQAQEPGLLSSWLESNQTTLLARQGGEQLKLHPLRPSRTIKQWCQELSVSVTERTQMKCLWHEDQLLWVSCLGLDVRYSVTTGLRLIPSLGHHPKR